MPPVLIWVVGYALVTTTIIVTQQIVARTEVASLNQQYCQLLMVVVGNTWNVWAKE